MKHPQQDIDIAQNKQFVVELLKTLREERYTPAAWQHFLLRSWRMSCETAQDHPILKRSWLRITVMMGVGALALVIFTGVFEGVDISFRLLPGLLFCVAWQQNDLYWHLGLNRDLKKGKLFEHVGLANILTGLRGLCASYLLGRLIGGVHSSNLLVLTVFVTGIVTDILDGIVARATKTQSKLGQIADSEADFCLYGAVNVILIQNGLLSAWLGIFMIARFFLPLLGALISYFVLAHPLHFGSTRWGKFAGLSQCCYILVLLASSIVPSELAPLMHLIAPSLLIITLILLLIAPIAQVMANLNESGW